MFFLDFIQLHKNQNTETPPKWNKQALLPINGVLPPPHPNPTRNPIQPAINLIQRHQLGVWEGKEEVSHLIGDYVYKPQLTFPTSYPLMQFFACESTVQILRSYLFELEWAVAMGPRPSMASSTSSTPLGMAL